MHIKIIDIGLASQIDEMILTEDGSYRFNIQKGSKLYTAPEVLKANPSYLGPEADVYSLGVILFYMFVGRNPFDPDCLKENDKLSAEEAVPFLFIKKS
jgi:serine/threonine protein kinase